MGAHVYGPVLLAYLAPNVGLHRFQHLTPRFEDFDDTILTEAQFDAIFLCLTVVYAIDLVVRFIGLGFRSVRSNGWNLFDFVVITGSFVTSIPALSKSSSGLLGDQVIVQLQKLFLVAIALKLVQRNNALNQLFKTLV